MIVRIWSGKSPLWRLLLPLSWLYGVAKSLARAGAGGGGW